MVAPYYGRVLHPPFVDMYVEKPAHTSSGYGYDYIPEGREIFGSVQHQTGSNNDTPESIARLFGPTGERYGEALTDYVTGRDGRLGRLNDPRGHRAGWASGGGVQSPGGLEGDGPPFYARFGAYGINKLNVSNENCMAWGGSLTLAQLETSSWLEAWIHDQARCPAGTYPVNPRWGIVMSFLHFEFGTTTCGKDLSPDDMPTLQGKARLILQDAQAGKVTKYTVKTSPNPVPEENMPNGMTVTEVSKRFGKLTRHNPDGSTTKAGFDPKGPISLTWYQRCVKDNVWPAADSWFVNGADDKRIDLMVFENGWVLLRKAPRASLVWA